MLHHSLSIWADEKLQDIVCTKPKMFILINHQVFGCLIVIMG